MNNFKIGSFVLFGFCVVIIEGFISSFGWYYGWNDIVYGMLNFYHPITWTASIILGCFPIITGQIGIFLLFAKLIMVVILSF